MRNQTKETMILGDMSLHRIGDDNMFITDPKVGAYSMSPEISASFARIHGYQIVPSSKLISENTMEQQYSIGSTRGLNITFGSRTEIIDDYMITSFGNTQNIGKTDHYIYEFGSKGIDAAIDFVAGNKREVQIYRDTYSYSPSKISATSSNVLTSIAAFMQGSFGYHNYTNKPVSYPSWNSYTKATNGTGPLLKYR